MNKDPEVFYCSACGYNTEHAPEQHECPEGEDPEDYVVWVCHDCGEERG